jgi:hypothetical protein
MPIIEKIEPEYQHKILLMIEEQPELLLKGFLPSHWKETARPWKPKMIRKIWETAKETWIEQCELATTNQDRYTETLICNLYKEKDNMSEYDADHIYRLPLEELLTLPRQEQVNWVHTFQTMIADITKQAAATMSTTNTRITNFFK